MNDQTAMRRAASARREDGALRLLGGRLRPFVDHGSVVDAAAPPEGDEPFRTVVADRLLQDAADHRGAIQAWFALTEVGGHLLIAVPHAFLYDRQIELPSRRHPEQYRLYTPASLMEEVEEALAPNSYRVRFLGDEAGEDGGDVLLALQRVPEPDDGLALPRAVDGPAPDYSFEPVRTRIEVSSHPQVRRVLALKLDHMGDFIMGMGALARLRALFPQAAIDLVVGSWNAEAAREIGVADRVIPFDAFPRNSSERAVDVHARADLFAAMVPDAYDLAIDLRTDTDTRLLLRRTRATIRAGIGTAAEFPFLDIFLPLDFNRNKVETAAEFRFGPHDFASQGSVRRADHRFVFEADRAERGSAIVWGPYRRLRPGRYLFEPWLELAEPRGGTLMIDVGLDARRAAYRLLPEEGPWRLPFHVERADSEFEFRIWTVEDLPAIDFSFFGGRLIREGAGSTLHQSEYGRLLVELVALRLERTGQLTDAAD